MLSSLTEKLVRDINALQKPSDIKNGTVIQDQDISERIEQLSVGSAYVQTPEMPYGSVTQMYPLKE